jgi:glutathione peroxidase-family protein
MSIAVEEKVVELTQEQLEKESLDRRERLQMIWPIWNTGLESASGEKDFLKKYEGKVLFFTNTTVGCGNANQLEVMQWLQDKFQDQGFSVIGVPTNDFCGAGITKSNHKPEKFAKGITCGMDSQEYSQEVYNTTFEYSEMTHSNPNDLVSETVGSPPGHNGVGEPYGEPHTFWKTIAGQSEHIFSYNQRNGIPHKSDDYYSWWLNLGFDGGVKMSGNYEKYLFDRDGYLLKNFNCQVLTYDHEKMVKDQAESVGSTLSMAPGRSVKVFWEEYEAVTSAIQSALDGELSLLNPKHPNYVISN